MDVELQSGYMLLFRGTEWDKDLSPEQIQDTMTRWADWFDGLMADGRAKSGQPLENDGVTIAGKSGAVVTDGPFSESKETVAGFFLLTVATMEEALEIARMCPALEHGMHVEVRPVRGSCPMMDKAEAYAAEMAP